MQTNELNFALEALMNKVTAKMRELNSDSAGASATINGKEVVCRAHPARNPRSTTKHTNWRWLVEGKVVAAKDLEKAICR